MAGPLLLALLAAAAVVRVPADVVRPKDVVDVSRLVDVSGDGPTGTFLTARRRQRPTVLQWLGAMAPGAAVAGPMAPDSIDGFDPLESALLFGAGVSPGRGSAEELGLSAVLRDKRTAASDAAIALYVIDAVSPRDVADGRRVLVLGVLGDGFTLTCPDDGLETYEATDPRPDVVVIAKGCPVAPELRRARAPLIEVTGLQDALQRLAPA